MKLPYFIIGAIFAIGVSFAEPAAAHDARAGIGRSKETPVGRPLELPDGIVVSEPIGAYIEDHCFPEEQEVRPQEGHGANIQLCLGFSNTLPTPVTISLPAGLIFVSFDTRSQNGLLIQTEAFEVPPGDNPYFVSLSLQCLNASRSTGRARDTYHVGPITQDEPITQLIRMLDGKALTDEHIPAVQNALWSVTDGDGLLPRDRDALEAIQ
ncbi:MULTISPECIES: hypothetical protein [unclassified Brevundimonas]|uniref:hypothetical protein n=1 Tax=unclassified Brevundimonas TaxID=2622653 RepID=UPI0025C20977|nr:MULTISPECIES: hypothetical protein [unclassified Brevundimonas]